MDEIQTQTDILKEDQKCPQAIRIVSCRTLIVPVKQCFANAQNAEKDIGELMLMVHT